MNIPSLVIGLAAGLFIGILACILYRNKKAKDDKEKIANAEEEALRIINDAIKSAESKKREATLEAKEEILRSRKEYEKEEKERRADLQKQERRLQQKEENIDRKTDAIEKKEEALAQKHAALDKENEEIKIIKRSQTEMLERISGFTADEAKKYLIEQVESEVTHETALKIKEIEARAKDEADQYAREIVASAIQRCAADHVAEITVSVVPLPNDEMKGRIIGREGRNIRTIETLTGVDLIIDDTPEAITVSCFEPVRREVARLALEKLIADGRIHPTHIEEMVAKARREVDAVIKSEGERAVLETGVRGLHPELVKLLGRLHYRTSYGQNVLQHSIEVAHLAGMMARTSPRRSAPACCTISARPSTTSSKAPTSRSAWSSCASTMSARTSSTRCRRTTTTSSRRPSSPASCRPPTPSPPRVPAPAARTSRTTSSASKSSRRSPAPTPASRPPTPFRRAARSA